MLSDLRVYIHVARPFAFGEGREFGCLTFGGVDRRQGVPGRRRAGSVHRSCGVDGRLGVSAVGGERQQHRAVPDRPSYVGLAVAQRLRPRRGYRDCRAAGLVTNAGAGVQRAGGSADFPVRAQAVRERLVAVVDEGLMRRVSDSTAPRANFAIMDYRSSVANVWRRRDAGEEASTCEGCGTEVDVNAPVHSPRCAVAA